MLGSHLLTDPEDALALALMAAAMLGQNKLPDAQSHAQRAIRAEPEFAYPHHMLATVLCHRGRAREAEPVAREAVRLDPDDGDNYALLGETYLRRKMWDEALAVADDGLRAEPDNHECSNVRTVALRNLGRTEEAAAQMRGQLSRSPEDDVTHANHGWTLLQEGKYQEALTHFQEALRLNPENEAAQIGVIECLKARHWFYRPALRFSLWLARMPGQWQAGIVLGAWFGYRIVKQMAQADTALAPVLWTVVALYLAFVAMTWFADPIANALLSFHPVGRLALPRAKRARAWAVVAMLAAAAAAAGFGFWQDSLAWKSLGLVLAFLCLPLKLTFDLDDPRAQRSMALFSAGVAVLGAYCAILAFQIDGLLAQLDALVERVGSSGSTPDPSAVTEEEFVALTQELDEKSGARNTLTLVYAILAFWISQFVAVALHKRSEQQ